ncbi:MAG: VWA domain-containing protein [Vicinamibacteraceae bacterium]|nr:VWA domain-containing protein [Vicinamibacteraceae bacterium]
MRRRAGLGLAGIVLSGAALAAQPTVFRASVDLVRVDVLATHRGRPVSGLAAADFEVRDNGVPQRVLDVSLEDVPIGVTLALDVSGSVQGVQVEQLTAAARRLIAGLRAEDALALVAFERRAHLVVERTRDHRRVSSIIGLLETGGGTSLRDATYATLTLRDPADQRAFAVVFTDGRDTGSWLRAGSVFEAARRSDVVVYGVQTRGRDEERAFLRPQGRRTFLEEIAAETGGRVLDAEWAELEQAFRDIVTEFRQRYVLSYEAQGVERTGWHTLEVKLKGRRGQVTARRGYFGAPR